jgi:hypothetical protein
MTAGQSAKRKANGFSLNADSSLLQHSSGPSVYHDLDPE